MTEHSHFSELVCGTYRQKARNVQKRPQQMTGGQLKSRTLVSAPEATSTQSDTHIASDKRIHEVRRNNVGNNPPSRFGIQHLGRPGRPSREKSLFLAFVSFMCPLLGRRTIARARGIGRTRLTCWIGRPFCVWIAGFVLVPRFDAFEKRI